MYTKERVCRVANICRYTVKNIRNNKQKNNEAQFNKYIFNLKKYILIFVTFLLSVRIAKWSFAPQQKKL